MGKVGNREGTVIRDTTTVRFCGGWRHLASLAVCRDVYYRACGRKVACDALVDIRIAAEYPNRSDWLKSKPDDWSRLLERAIVEAKFQTEIRDAASDALDEAYREIERAIACASEVDAL